MHSATANDYMPNGLLLLVGMYLLLDAPPWLVGWSLLKTMQASNGTSKTGVTEDTSLPQGDT